MTSRSSEAWGVRKDQIRELGCTLYLDLYLYLESYHDWRCNAANGKIKILFLIIILITISQSNKDFTLILMCACVLCEVITAIQRWGRSQWPSVTIWAEHRAVPSILRTSATSSASSYMESCTVEGTCHCHRALYTNSIQRPGNVIRHCNVTLHQSAILVCGQLCDNVISLARWS